MCYPKPGPRCSNHAFKRFASANTALQEARNSRDDQKVIAASAAYAEAKREYMMTPAGQKQIQLQIQKTGDPTGELKKALDKSIRERKAALKRVKMDDHGDIDSHAPKKVAGAPMTEGEKAYVKKMQENAEKLEKINATRASQGLVPLSSVNSVRMDGDVKPRAAYGEYDSAKIPQANDLDKVSSATDAISNGATTARSLAESLGVDKRQGHYYATAGEYIGLLEKSTKGEGGEHEYHLTANGEAFRQASPEERKVMLKELVNATPVMESYRESGYNKAVLEEDIAMSGYDESTARRRASTIAGWHQKMSSGNFEAELSQSQKDVVARSKVAAEKQRQEREEKARLAREEAGAPVKKDFGHCVKHGYPVNSAGKGCPECDWDN